MASTPHLRLRVKSLRSRSRLISSGTLSTFPPDVKAHSCCITLTSRVVLRCTVWSPTWYLSLTVAPISIVQPLSPSVKIRCSSVLTRTESIIRDKIIMGPFTLLQEDVCRSLVFLDLINPRKSSRSPTRRTQVTYPYGPVEE